MEPVGRCPPGAAAPDGVTATTNMEIIDVRIGFAAGAVGGAASRWLSIKKW